MKTKFLCILSLFFMFSCSQNEQENFYAIKGISVSTDFPDTKTVINNNRITYSWGDELLLVCEGYNSMSVSNQGQSSVNNFYGTYHALGKSGEDCSWYGLYPYSVFTESSDGVYTGTLPQVQAYPFDSGANLMYSDIIVDDYDEESQPALALSMNQMCGLIKISFKNTNESYKDEVLQTIKFTSSAVISGDFAFDINSVQHYPVFTDEGYKSVISECSETTLLGTEEHDLYLFVNPVAMQGATITIRTDKHTFTKTSSKDISILAGKLSVIPTFTLDAAGGVVIDGPTSLNKRLACWGDSYTHSAYDITYITYLSKFLGNDWVIYDGGCPGERCDEIAARQGALPIVTSEEFYMPLDTKKTNIPNVYKTYNESLEDGYYDIRIFGSRLCNPCYIDDIECTITQSSGLTFLQRTTTSSSQVAEYISAHTPIESYASRFLKDVDLQIIYMGTNGGWDHTGSVSDEHYYDNLVGYHRRMIDFVDNKKDYIILAYHTGAYNTYYWNRFKNEFGPENPSEPLRIVNLHDELRNRGIELMIKVGAYPDEASIPQSEKDRLANGELPLCFVYKGEVPSSTDVSHPSHLGAKAFAYLIYEKMKELGYVL